MAQMSPPPAVNELLMPEVGVAGIGYRLLISAEQSGGAYELMYFVAPPGVACPMHMHQHEDECAYMLEGEIEGFVGGHLVRTPAGSALHLPRKVPHGFRNSGTVPARFLMWVTPGNLSGFYESCLTQWDVATKNKQPPSEAELMSLGQTAANYGIEILPV